MGEHYPPHAGNVQTISIKSPNKIEVNRNDAGDIGMGEWEIIMTFTGNLELDPPEIDTIEYTHEIDGLTVKEFESTIQEMPLIDLAKVAYNIRIAAQRLKYMHSEPA